MRSKHTSLLILFITTVIFLNPLSSIFAKKEKVNADKILYVVRNYLVEDKIQLSGTLRKKFPYELYKKHKFNILISNDLINLTFPKSNQKIRIIKNNDNLKISESINPDISKKNNFKAITNDKYSRPLLNTDITYGDISFAYLYWENPKLLSDSAVVNSRFMFKIETLNPDPNHDIAKVHLWIDKKFLALMKVEAFYKNNNLAKRMTVVAIKKFNKMWLFKQLRLETFSPTTKKIIGRSYIDLKMPKELG